MTYHDLSTCTVSADERRDEADKILEILREVDWQKYTPQEFSFLDTVNCGGPVSVKQLFWLRDIKDKYL